MQGCEMSVKSVKCCMIFEQSVKFSFAGPAPVAPGPGPGPSESTIPRPGTFWGAEVQH